jgi:hypothetical protein
MTKTYRVKLTFGSFLLRANFSEASSNISTNFDPDEEMDSWSPTRFQVADSCHNEKNAAVLVLKDCGQDFWLDPSDASKIGLVISEEDYIKSQIKSIKEL